MRFAVLFALCACGSVQGTPIDARGADACVPESDTEFCTKATACEMHSGMDNCGVARNVDCGACTGGQGCVVGTCKTPVCGPSFTYARANYAPFTQAGIEDSMGTATPDLKTIVYIKTLAPSSCGNYHVIIADETTPGTYTQLDATSNFTASGLWTGQEEYAITADGLTIITVTANRKQLVAVKRSAVGVIDFGAPSTTDFAAINATLPTAEAGVFFSPVLSADGLEFFYTIIGYPSGDAKNGVFQSVRSSTSVPFPAPVKMPAPINDPTDTGQGQLSAISSDRLAVFVFYNYGNRVFTRTSTSGQFTNPNGSSPPPLIPGWDHKPLADCSKLVGMYSPGGCANEDVVLMTRQ
jgi:hypothetical protein